MPRPKDYVVVGEIDSDSQPGVLHLIKRLRSNGVLSCDCMAYRFKRGEKTCKHVEVFQASSLRDEIRQASSQGIERDFTGMPVLPAPPAFTEQAMPRPGVRRLRLRD